MYAAVAAAAVSVSVSVRLLCDGSEKIKQIKAARQCQQFVNSVRASEIMRSDNMLHTNKQHTRTRCYMRMN